MKKVLFLFVLLAVAITHANSQKFAVKSNLLYDLTTTPNLGIEFALGQKWTLDISGNYNPWTFGEDCEGGELSGDPILRLKHWMVQPELRYWTCEKFNGHFFGIHGHYADYNVGGIKFLSDNMKNHRYQGTLYGAGLTYGYQWLLGNRWSMEAVIGAGWAHMEHDKFYCPACCGTGVAKERDYFGVTKVALSIIYFIK